MRSARRHRGTNGEYRFLICALALLLPGAAAPEPPSVNIASSLVKVPRHGHYPTLATAALEAARREYENVQVVVTAGRAPISALSATASALGGPGGAIIPAPRLYRVDYVIVTTPSSAEGSRGPWPDPLVPAVDGYVGEARHAFPCAVAAHENQPIWVELRVPTRAPPGDYQGTVHIVADGHTRDVPLRLTVFPFTLPRAPSLPILVGVSGLSIGRAHRGEARDVPALTRRYAQALVRHRLDPIGGSMEPPPHTWDGHHMSVDFAVYDAEIAALLDGTLDPESPGARVAATDLRLPAGVSGAERDALLDAWVRHFDARGWHGRLFDYTIDEPKPADFARARDRASAMRRAGIPALVTHALDPALRGPDDLFDIWTPLVNDLDDKPAHRGGQTPRPPARGAYGSKTVYWYQSCMSHGCDRPGGPYFSGWPSYAIDVPSAVAHRIFEWLSWRYGTSGELYYNSVEAYNDGDPWRDPRRHGAAGDGTLFYPGRAERIGGKTDIPIESIRLKLMRDGAEDYEYLALAPRAVAAREVAELAPRTFNWNHSPAALAQARHRIARTIASQPVEISNDVTKAHSAIAPTPTGRHETITTLQR
jgi:hypothetical protein